MMIMAVVVVVVAVTEKQRQMLLMIEVLPLVEEEAAAVADVHWSSFVCLWSINEGRREMKRSSISGRLLAISKLKTSMSNFNVNVLNNTVTIVYLAQKTSKIYFYL